MYLIYIYGTSSFCFYSITISFHVKGYVNASYFNSIRLYENIFGVSKGKNIFFFEYLALNVLQ